jgi:DNA-binding transcriptional ArsR family regulator
MRIDARKDGAADTLFRMLADPTRRRILDLLAERGPLNVTELAEEFPDLVASGISKHLMGLRGAGLVQANRDGRQQVYSLEADAMRGVLAPWLRKYERFWQGALERLRDLAENEAEESGARHGRVRPVRARRGRKK